MRSLELNHNWKMRTMGDADWLEATVPGTVYGDLLQNGKMEDPYYGDREQDALKLMDRDYEYRCEFETPQWASQCDDVLLHFEGLDTLAEVRLNGQKLGDADNQHRTWEFEVGKLLSPKGNRLTILLGSPVFYIHEKRRIYDTKGSEDCMEGFMHLRKAHYMFGWDWGAHLPDAGIFRPVKLLGIQKARLDSVRIHQEHSDGRVKITMTPEVLPAGMVTSAGHGAMLRQGRDLPGYENKGADYTFRYEILDPQGQKVVGCEEEGDASVTLVISKPQLWWPNGLGEQPLYRVKVSMLEKTGSEPGKDPAVLDIWERRIGLRSLTVLRRKDQWGESFAQEVNGRPFFAMGADYIPEDHILARCSAERSRRLLEDCRLANFNSIRVWGGGLYPDDDFYDLCDELGLVVWQDCMFACAMYVLTEEFEKNIRAEVADNVRRLRHHASLGIWSGNNEMEQFTKSGTWVSNPTEVKDYLMMYERVIPEVIRANDPDTFYWPSSPSSGGSFDDPSSPDRGDVHYWDVWHGNKPFQDYRNYHFRYVSEFGFQSFPSVQTLRTAMAEEDLNPFSYVMEKHQRNGTANGKIMTYLGLTHRYPLNFETFVYASQLLQAEAIRYGVEHFRRNRNDLRCMGAVYWQLNDCWPVISWASIDYCGRWKALHYAMKRAFAPVMVSCEENGMTCGITNINAEDPTVHPSFRLCVNNETLQERKVRLSWDICSADGLVIDGEREVLTLPPMTAVWTEKMDLPVIDIFGDYLSYSITDVPETDPDRCISEGTAIFVYPKYFHFRDPKLKVEVQGDEILVSAQAYDKSVYLSNENDDLVLEDNYFDMNPGTRRVKILRGDPKGLKAMSVYDIGRQ